MERKYHSNLAFNDLLFNILIGFVVLFIIAFLLINPPTKKDEVPMKAEWIIMVQWPEDSYDDVDTWVMAPNGNLVGFKNKETGLLHLDRDDLGMSSDMYVVAGETVTTRVNREIVTIRGVLPGDYYISLHMYSKKDENITPVTVTVMDVNPYNEVYAVTVDLVSRGDQVILPGFTVDDKGNLAGTWKTSKSVVPTIGGGN